MVSSLGAFVSVRQTTFLTSDVRRQLMYLSAAVIRAWFTPGDSTRESRPL